MATEELSRWPAISWFREQMCLDLLHVGWAEMKAALEVFPKHDPIRQERAIAAGNELLAIGNAQALAQLALFLDAELGIALERDAVGDAAREWIACWESRREGRVDSRPAAGLMGFFLDWWARCILTESGNSGRGTAEADWRVVDQLCRFFVRRSLPGETPGEEPLQLSQWELRLEFSQLASQGLPRPFLASLVCQWLAALSRTEQWEAVKGVAESYAELAWPSFSWRLALGQGTESGTPGANEPDTPELVALQPLTYWLRAVSIEGDDRRIPPVATAILRSWERLRDALESEAPTDFDDQTFWGSGLWALEALVRRMEYLRNGTTSEPTAEQEVVGALLRSLEAFSARMALNRLASPREPSAPPTAQVSAPPATDRSLRADAAPDNGLIADPTPNLDPLGVARLPFASAQNAGARLQPLPSEGRADAAEGQAVARCEPELYRWLTRDLDGEGLADAIDGRTAFLGCYDLPGTGQPVIALTIRDPVVGLVVEAATRPTDRRRHSGDDGLLHFDSRVTEAWLQYALDTRQGPTEAALGALAERIGNAFQSRHSYLNRLYGPVLDEVLRRVVDRGIRSDRLRETDLVVAVRGKVATAAIELLGLERPLGSLFASVTVTPCLRVFKWLEERANQARPIACPLRLSVAGWEPRRADHPGHGTMVQHLMERVLEEFQHLSSGEDPALELRLAAEEPMASRRRTEAMMSSTDWGIIFGHGSRTPYGVRLSDGLYPGERLRDGEDVREAPASVLLVCGCFAGRFAQSSRRTDALSPILDELNLSLLLRDMPAPAHRPTCVGAFVNEIPGVVGADFLIDLITERLRRATLGPSAGPAGFLFARAQQELVRRYLSRLGLTTGLPGRRSLGQLAREKVSNARDVLALFTALSFRLVGVEPQVRVFGDVEPERGS